MANAVEIEKMLPIYKVENNSILSMFGDITIAYKIALPEIFTLSVSEYEAFHQAWVKAIRVLPKHSCFHKQDWFMADNYKANFINRSGTSTFLSGASERFFNERPYLNHQCYIFLSKKPEGRRLASSAFSNLFRRSVVPSQSLDQHFVDEFLDKANQFMGEEMMADEKLNINNHLDQQQLDYVTNVIIPNCNVVYLHCHSGAVPIRVPKIDCSW